MSQDASHELRTATAARAAKARVRQLVSGDRRVNGVGLTRSPSWAVKVNIVDANDSPKLPDSIGGIPVLVSEVGRVSAVGRISARAS